MKSFIFYRNETRKLRRKTSSIGWRKKRYNFSRLLYANETVHTCPLKQKSVLNSLGNFVKSLFLSRTQIYQRVCPSICPFVPLSVCKQRMSPWLQILSLFLTINEYSMFYNNKFFPQQPVLYFTSYSFYSKQIELKCWERSQICKNLMYIIIRVKNVFTICNFDQFSIIFWKKFPNFKVFAVFLGQNQS